MRGGRGQGRAAVRSATSSRRWRIMGRTRRFLSSRPRIHTTSRTRQRGATGRGSRSSVLSPSVDRDRPSCSLETSSETRVGRFGGVGSQSPALWRLRPRNRGLRDASTSLLQSISTGSPSGSETGPLCRRASPYAGRSAMSSTTHSKGARGGRSSPTRKTPPTRCAGEVRPNGHERQGQARRCPRGKVP